MFTYRAITNCPTCNTPEEIWISSGKVFPSDNLLCSNCNFIYNSSSFISQLLMLRKNLSISVDNLEEIC